MPGIPTLGYPTRTDAVAALRRQGRTRKEIADALKTNHRNVRSLENYAANRGRPRADDRRRVTLGKKTQILLAPYAAARGISLQKLARRILETAALDGLVAGILDDKDAAQ